MTESIFSVSADLGYEFHAGTRVTGYRALTVNFLPVPSEQHYDPEHMHIPALTLAGDVQQLDVHHPWHDRSDWHVAPGCITLSDRKRKVVESFTFGGTLHVASQAQSTHATVDSPAPILAVTAGFHTGAADAASIFVEEVRMLFARARAAWNGDDAGFLRNLATIDAALLYAACRQAVGAHLRAQPEHLRLTRYRSTLHLLRVMEVEDPIPGYVTPLSEMLQPDPERLQPGQLHSTA